MFLANTDLIKELKFHNPFNSITNSPNMRSPGFNRHKPDLAVKNALPVDDIGSMAIDFLSSGVYT